MRRTSSIRALLALPALNFAAERMTPGRHLERAGIWKRFNVRDIQRRPKEWRALYLRTADALAELSAERERLVPRCTNELVCSIVTPSRREPKRCSRMLSRFAVRVDLRSRACCARSVLEGWRCAQDVVRARAPLQRTARD